MLGVWFQGFWGLIHQASGSKRVGGCESIDQAKLLPRT